MRTSNIEQTGLLVCVFSTMTISLSLATTAYGVSLETVPVGNPDNPPDTTSEFPYPGSVPYRFRIATSEVTNAQYVEFLNAVAASDPNGLYNPLMTSDTRGGIVRTGSSGGYTYAVKAAAIGQGPDGGDYAYENKPVVFVSVTDSVRFANWLHNAQGGPGTTEHGAYTFPTEVEEGDPVAVRNPGARWFLPTDNEWYKSAYYDSSSGLYFNYPTGTDTRSNNNLPSADTGNSANFWDFNDGTYTTGDESYPMTDVGAYALSASPYGTFDQGGSVYEWNESALRESGLTCCGKLLGGSWHEDIDFALLAEDFGGFLDPPAERFDIGFRVATIPEPASGVLAIVACGLMFWWRKRSESGSDCDLHIVFGSFGGAS